MADVHTGAPAPGSPPVEGEHVLAAPWPVEEDRSAGDVAPVTGGRQAAGGVPGLADRGPALPTPPPSRPDAGLVEAGLTTLV